MKILKKYFLVRLSWPWMTLNDLGQMLKVAVTLCEFILMDTLIHYIIISGSIYFYFVQNSLVFAFTLWFLCCFYYVLCVFYIVLPSGVIKNEWMNEWITVHRSTMSLTNSLCGLPVLLFMPIVIQKPTIILPLNTMTATYHAGQCGLSHICH